MIEQRARFKRLRDRSIFVGSPDDIVDDSFGPGLPGIRDVDAGQLRLRGLRRPVRPRAASATATSSAPGSAIRADERSALVTVGGSGVGEPLLRRIVDAVPLVRRPPSRPALRRRHRAADRSSIAPRRSGLTVTRLPADSSTSTSPSATSPSYRAGSDDLYGAHREPAAVPVRPAQASLRAELPRTPATRALRRRPMPGLRRGRWSPTCWQQPSPRSSATRCPTGRSRPTGPLALPLLADLSGEADSAGSNLCRCISSTRHPRSRSG